MQKHLDTKKFSTEWVRGWCDQEFAGVQLGDARLQRRLKMLVEQFVQQPEAPIPQACGNWAQSKAAYRFFDNGKVDPQEILRSHTQGTLERCREQAVILAVQDTTELNYSTHPQTEDLGPISSNADQTIGFLVHSTMAVTLQGVPLGLLEVQTWARESRQFGQNHQRKGRPLTDKESYKWVKGLRALQALQPQVPQTQLVMVADRDADLYELFVEALAPAPQPVHVLVRAHQNRGVLKEHERLWKHLAGQAVAAELTVQVSAKGGQPPRKAVLEVRFCAVTLTAPLLKAGQPEVKLWAVEAKEVRCPAGCKPICWRLLTSLPVESAAAAVEKVQWYALRWQIEVLHKVLKSGCKIEQRQLESRARLERVLAVDMIVAWRVMYLVKMARENPQTLVSQYLSEPEWQALYCYVHKTRECPAQPPTIHQVVRWIAQLGGFLGRKGDGEPGPIVLWRGLQKLQCMAPLWRLLRTP